MRYLASVSDWPWIYIDPLVKVEEDTFVFVASQNVRSQSHLDKIVHNKTSGCSKKADKGFCCSRGKASYKKKVASST